MRGPCIVHAHVNLIPGFGHLYNLLDDALPLLASIDDLGEIADMTKPYILMRRPSANARIYGAENASSQLVRKMLCTRFGREDWDWGVFSNDVWINETIKLWCGAGN